MKFKLYCLCLISLFSQPLFSENPFCNGCFSFTGELLYYTPLIDSPYFFIDNNFSTASPLGTRRANQTSYDPGFRIGGQYSMCDGRDIHVAWTRFFSTQKESVFVPFLHPTQGPPSSQEDQFINATGRSELTFHLNRVEALWGNNIYCGNYFGLIFNGGLQYSHLKLLTDINLTNAVNELSTSARFWGIGPQFGFACEYPICNSLSLIGDVNGALLVGKSNSFYRFRNPTLANDVKSIDVVRIVPSFFMRLGGEYSHCFSCFNFSVGVGYEFLSYLSAWDNMIFPDDVFENLIIDIFSDASFHGPYVSLTVGY